MLLLQTDQITVDATVNHYSFSGVVTENSLSNSNTKTLILDLTIQCNWKLRRCRVHQWLEKLTYWVPVSSNTGEVSPPTPHLTEWRPNDYSKISNAFEMLRDLGYKEIPEFSELKTLIDQAIDRIIWNENQPTVISNTPLPS